MLCKNCCRCMLSYAICTYDNKVIQPTEEYQNLSLKGLLSIGCICTKKVIVWIEAGNLSTEFMRFFIV